MTEQYLDEAEWVPWLRLSQAAGVGRARANRLLERYGSPEAILEQTEDELMKGARLPAPVAAAVVRPGALDEARTELARLRQLRVKLVRLGSPDYPELLREVDFPPVILGRLGPLADPGQRAIAIVGSRRAGTRAMRIAFEFARAFASEGITVVSGLARGIDRAAHEGALAVPEGRTVGVLGCGLSRVYPTEHTRLAGRIRERGALWSELPADASPSRFHFPERNRIIAGASLGLVVIAAGDKSGTSHTVRHAESYGRTVFAIPGSVDDDLARGTNKLIKTEGAQFIEGPSEVLEALGFVQPKPNTDIRPPLFGREPAAPAEPLTGVPGEIVRFLEGEARICTFDEIVHSNRIDARAAMSALGFLAIRRRVREVPGAGYVAVG